MDGTRLSSGVSRAGVGGWQWDLPFSRDVCHGGWADGDWGCDVTRRGGRVCVFVFVCVEPRFLCFPVSLFCPILADCLVIEQESF